MKIRKLKVLMLLALTTPLACYAVGDSMPVSGGSFSFPAKVIVTPCTLTPPDNTDVEVPFNDLKGAGKQGSIELGFYGCAHDEKVNITATSTGNGPIEMYLSKDSASQQASTNNVITLDAISTDNGGNATGTLYYNIKLKAGATESTSAGTLAGKKPIQIELTQTYE